MNFQLSIASMFQLVKDLSIEREHVLADLLLTYEAEQESSSCPDRTLLYRARALLEERLAHCEVDRELVELGHTTYRSLGAWYQEIALLRCYLSTQLTQNEQAWARWHIIDCLSLARNADEAVKEQQAFLQWATTVFPLEDYFFVIADGTQARSWLTLGRGYDWLYQHEQLSTQARKTAQNRLDRFYCFRTGIYLCLELGDTTRVHRYLTALHLLQQEDATWPELKWVSVEIAILEIVTANKNGEIAQVRALAQKTITDMHEWECCLNTNEQSEIGRFRSLCHNLAAPLYCGKQYDLAIPLLQKAIHYHTNPCYSYLWLAASLWQTSHQREQVFPYLRQAVARYDGEGNPWDTFKKLPEFADVQQDPEFLAVTDLS